ncbi:MAG: DUF1361 domain-containing protein [Acidimicrobiales bacterium]|nr:DUF1361 domain-containing protein [Acidimicrobiales bacterium]
MGYLDAVLSDIAATVRANRFWMGWNTVLAMIPAGLALVLFFRPHRRTAAWWAGVVAFALFLPNAPYVITDLIHLRWLIGRASGGSTVVFGILPLMAAFIAVCYLAYLVCLEGIVREVRSVRPGTARPVIELPVHAVCAVGVVLGRVARLNSWDTVQNPRWTVEEVFNTLSWRGAPFAVVAVFVAMVVTTTVLRVLVDASWRATRSVTTRLRPA